jgi:hypothetical protein
MEDLQALSLAWNAILKIVALTGLLSSCLTWIVLRFTKPLDSYTEEFAKQVARHQNLDKLVEETQRLTDTAEKIKVGLSHEAWDRQTRLLAKRDLYVRIAEALGDLRNSYIHAKGMERLRRQGVSYPPEGVVRFEEQRKKGLQAMEDAMEKWHRATDAAPLMIPDEPYKPLREFNLREIRFGTSLWEKDFDDNVARVQGVLYHFQVAARADLGFEPMAWKPSVVDAPRFEPDWPGVSSSEKGGA